MDLEKMQATVRTRYEGWFPDREWDDKVAGWVVGRRGDRVIWMVPQIVTYAVIIGRAGRLYYEDRWCYTDPVTAMAQAMVWVANPDMDEPWGWVRHPSSGRRRGADGKEWVAP